MIKRKLLVSALALTGSLALVTPTFAAINLTGAGSTFDYPFFSKAFSVYQSQTGVSTNYQSIGSGAGIAQLQAKTVDFGASDVPMNSADLTKAGAAIVQIPVALGGVSIVYNVPNVKAGLHLSPDVLAGIFLGTITNWNDRKIHKLNPKVRLPNLQITVAHRSDGSGTTYIFSDYLSKVSDSWRGQVGTGKALSWPVGVGGKGNEGVAATVEQTPGGIGYVELAYARQTHAKQAALENRSHKFVADTQKAVAVAASTLPKVSPTHFSIVDAKGAKSYPICGYSWAMMYKSQSDAAKGKALVKLMTWLTTKGQKYAGKLDYVSLPKNVQVAATKTVKSVK